jgi:hypothetical protein
MRRGRNVGNIRRSLAWLWRGQQPCQLGLWQMDHLAWLSFVWQKCGLRHRRCLSRFYVRSVCMEKSTTFARLLNLHKEGVLMELL